jgi:hypothetical protein
LDADAIPLRSSPLWSVDLKALQVALDGEQELQRREHALQQQGLRVILGTRASALRESADLLEKQPLFKNLLNQLSGTTGRALKLAREIGANDPAQRPSALRDVAKVVELRESYGPGWKKRMVSLELPSHRLLPITEQLQSLKKILETSSHGPVWGGWLREATAEDLQAALTAYGQGLETRSGHRPFWSKASAHYRRGSTRASRTRHCWLLLNRLRAGREQRASGTVWQWWTGCSRFKAPSNGRINSRSRSCKPFSLVA